MPPAPDAPATRRSRTVTPPRKRDRRLGRDLTVIALITALVLGALVAAGVIAYRELYSPSAFVRHYLHLLHENRAAEALAVPGVAIDTADLEAAGLDIPDSDALLRAAAMGTLTDIEIISEETAGAVTDVTARFDAGGVTGTGRNTKYAISAEQFLPYINEQLEKKIAPLLAVPSEEVGLSSSLKALTRALQRHIGIRALKQAQEANS